METATTRSINTKTLKRQRVMRYFIDAAREIANADGIGGINIRSVADKAGYNSASLYNYFENLDQLISFTCIDMMSEWLRDLAKISDKDGDALDQYLLGWRSFCLHAFAEPTAYSYVYASKGSEKSIEYFDDYVQAFPNTFENIPEILIEMFQAKTIEEQEEIMICPCVEAGFFSHETAKEIYELAHILSKGIMVWMSGTTRTVEKSTRQFMRYFVSFIQAHLDKEKDLSAYLE